MPRGPGPLSAGSLLRMRGLPHPTSRWLTASARAVSLSTHLAMEARKWGTAARRTESARLGGRRRPLNHRRVEEARAGCSPRERASGQGCGRSGGVQARISARRRMSRRRLGRVGLSWEVGGRGDESRVHSAGWGSDGATGGQHAAGDWTRASRVLSRLRVSQRSGLPFP